MERVIVTVKRGDEAQTRDLEVPAEVESGRLAELIAHALRWDSDAAGRAGYQIEAHPPGRFLRSDESLMSAGVWDGAWLVLHPIGSISAPGFPPSDHPAAPPPPAPPQGGPVGGWRSLGIDLPPASDQQPAPSPEEKRPSGFVWKQVD